MHSIQIVYLINRIHCSKNHIISNIEDLTTSLITLHLLSQQDKILNLQEFSEKLHEYIRTENYDIYKHYENLIFDVDIKAENLIQFFHVSRDKLRKQAKDYFENPRKFSKMEVPTLRTNLYVNCPKSKQSYYR